MSSAAQWRWVFMMRRLERLASRHEHMVITLAGGYRYIVAERKVVRG